MKMFGYTSIAFLWKKKTLERKHIQWWVFCLFIAPTIKGLNVWRKQAIGEKEVDFTKTIYAYTIASLIILFPIIESLVFKKFIPISVFILSLELMICLQQKVNLVIFRQQEITNLSNVYNILLLQVKWFYGTLTVTQNARRVYSSCYIFRFCMEDFLLYKVC